MRKGLWGWHLRFACGEPLGGHELPESHVLNAEKVCEIGRKSKPLPVFLCAAGAIFVSLGKKGSKRLYRLRKTMCL